MDDTQKQLALTQLRSLQIEDENKGLYHKFAADLLENGYQSDKAEIQKIRDEKDSAVATKDAQIFTLTNQLIDAGLIPLA